jgi:hypothetical protein
LLTCKMVDVLSTLRIASPPKNPVLRLLEGSYDCSKNNRSHQLVVQLGPKEPVDCITRECDSRTIGASGFILEGRLILRHNW